MDAVVNNSKVIWTPVVLYSSLIYCAAQGNLSPGKQEGVCLADLLIINEVSSIVTLSQTTIITAKCNWTPHVRSQPETVRRP